MANSETPGRSEPPDINWSVPKEQYYLSQLEKAPSAECGFWLDDTFVFTEPIVRLIKHGEYSVIIRVRKFKKDENGGTYEIISVVGGKVSKWVKESELPNLHWPQKDTVHDGNRDDQHGEKSRILFGTDNALYLEQPREIIITTVKSAVSNNRVCMQRVLGNLPQVTIEWRGERIVGVVRFVDINNSICVVQFLDPNSGEVRTQQYAFSSVVPPLVEDRSDSTLEFQEST